MIEGCYDDDDGHEEEHDEEEKKNDIYGKRTNYREREKERLFFFSLEKKNTFTEE